MFWVSTIVLGLSVLLVKLGAVSVWVTILSNGLGVALLVICCLVVALIWKSMVESKS